MCGMKKTEIKKTIEILKEKRYNSKGSFDGPNAGITQSVEHFTRNEGVVSSSLISGFREKRAQLQLLKELRLFSCKKNKR